MTAGTADILRKAAELRGVNLKRVTWRFDDFGDPDRIVGIPPIFIWGGYRRREIFAPIFEWETRDGKRFFGKTRAHINRDNPQDPRLDMQRCFDDALNMICRAALSEGEA